MVTSKYTTNTQRRNRSEVHNTTIALRMLLENFIQEDKASAIKRLNTANIRPKDVIQFVLGRSLTPSECTLYLYSVSCVPVDLQHAFRLGKVWQDLKQTARKQLQGNTADSPKDFVKKFRSFIQNMDASRQRID